MTTIIALDPGFGNTKVCIDGKVAVMQSAVSQPVNVGMASLGLKTADTGKVVSFDGYAFMVGEGAWRWGRSLGSMDYAGLVGPERLALMYAGIAELIQPNADVISETYEIGEVYLVIGFPVPLMQDEAQMGPMVESLRKLKREHTFLMGHTSYHFAITGVKVLAQPVGAFMDWLYNDELQQRVGAAKSEVAVVDLGMNTLDLFVVERGKVRPGFLGGDKVGVRRLLNLLSPNGYDITEVDAMLRDGRLKAKDGQIDIWLGEVIGVIERTWPSLKRFNAVIPTGGGAALLAGRLTGALGAKGAALYWPADPITANVKGFWKYANSTRTKKEPGQDGQAVPGDEGREDVVSHQPDARARA